MRTPLHTEMKAGDPSLLSHQGYLDSFFVRRMISVGGFGQVFEGTAPNGDTVAVKVESLKASIQLLANEASCLRNLNRVCNPSGQRETEPFLKYLGYGCNDDVRYIAMEKCGENLRDLKKRTEFDRFSITTSLWLMHKMIKALQTMHLYGWLHRDVKPANFCVGLTNKKALFVLDFGMSRCYLASDGSVKTRKPHSSFHGTIRYVSTHIHRREDASRWDDLWSVLYISIENMSSQLPWRHINDKNEVGELKEKFEPSDVSFGVEQYPPHSVNILHHYLAAAKNKIEEYFYFAPPYDLLLSETKTDLSRRGINDMNGMHLDWLSIQEEAKVVQNSNYVGDFMATPKKERRRVALGEIQNTRAVTQERSVCFY